MLHRPSTQHAEDCKSIVREQIREHLGLELAIEDISIAHRIGVKPKIQGQDKRNIIFKLCNSDIKQNNLKSCTVVKPTKFNVIESLTSLRNTILYVMRQAKKKHPSVINSCNSSDGSVVAWLHAATASGKTKFRKIIINTKKELDLFLQQETDYYSSPNNNKFRAPKCNMRKSEMSINSLMFVQRAPKT